MRIIKCLGLCYFMACIFMACGNNTIKGENGKEYESYREACRDGDFNAAHKFLDRLKEKVEDRSSDQKYQEAEDYIFNYEANALISQNSEEANTRVIYLLNEIPIEGTKCTIGESARSYSSVYGESCNRYNIKCNKILELAISLKNQDMAKKIIPLFKEDEIIGGSLGSRKVLAYTYDTRDAAQAKYDEAFGEKEETVEEEEVRSSPKESKKKRRK